MVSNLSIITNNKMLKINNDRDFTLCHIVFKVRAAILLFIITSIIKNPNRYGSDIS